MILNSKHILFEQNVLLYLPRFIRFYLFQQHRNLYLKGYAHTHGAYLHGTYEHWQFIFAFVFSKRENIIKHIMAVKESISFIKLNIANGHLGQ